MVEFGETQSPEDEFEQELRAALRPDSAPDGFADRVIARTQQLPPATKTWATHVSILRHGSTPPLRTMLRWSIAAILLLSVTIGGFMEHRRQRQIAGEHARQQVLLALRITSITLQAVRNRVDKNSPN